MRDNVERDDDYDYERTSMSRLNGKRMTTASTVHQVKRHQSSDYDNRTTDVRTVQVQFITTSGVIYQSPPMRGNSGSAGRPRYTRDQKNGPTVTAINRNSSTTVTQSLVGLRTSATFGHNSPNETSVGSKHQRIIVDDEISVDLPLSKVPPVTPRGIMTNAKPRVQSQWTRDGATLESDNATGVEDDIDGANNFYDAPCIFIRQRKDGTAGNSINLQDDTHEMRNSDFNDRPATVMQFDTGQRSRSRTQLVGNNNGSRARDAVHLRRNSDNDLHRDQGHSRPRHDYYDVTGADDRYRIMQYANNGPPIAGSSAGSRSYNHIEVTTPRTWTAKSVDNRQFSNTKENKRHDNNLSTRQSNDSRRAADRQRHAYSSSAAWCAERQRRHNYDDSSDSDASPVNHHASFYGPDGRTTRNDNRSPGCARDANQRSIRQQHREFNRRNSFDIGRQRSRRQEPVSTNRVSREPADIRLDRKRHRRDSSSTSTDRSSSRERRSFDDLDRRRCYSDTEGDSDDQQSTYSNRRSSPCHSVRTKIRPDSYDGKADIETYLAKFRACSRYNGWSSRDKAAFLKSSLSGEAASLLWRHTNASYKELVDLLKLRFGTYEQQERFRLELKFRRRQAGESLQELMSDISRLVCLAYPRAEPQLQDILAVDAFVDSLNNVGLEFKIREAEPATLRQAMLTAMKFEGLYNVRRQRQEGQKPRQVRRVTSHDSPDSDHGSDRRKVENENRSFKKRRSAPAIKSRSANSPNRDRQGRTVRKLNKQLQELRCSAVTSPQPARQSDQQSIADSTMSRSTSEELQQLRDELNKQRLQIAAMTSPIPMPTYQLWQPSDRRPTSSANAGQLQQQQVVPSSPPIQWQNNVDGPTPIGAKTEPHFTDYLL